MSKLKKIVGLLVLLTAVLLGGLRIRQAYVMKQESDAKAAQKKGGARIVSVSVGQAQTGAVHEEILLTGSLRPKEQVDVTAKATGRIEKLFFQLGDRVNKGDLIAEMEDDELQQQVNRAHATISVNQASTRQRTAELANAKALVDRSDSLLKEGLIPKTDYESRVTSYQVVEAQLQLAQAQERQSQADLNELNIRLEQTKIFAPMTGYVARRNVDEGAVVSPNTPILTLVNIDTMVTQANVPEREVGKLHVGAAARVQVDAFGDNEFTGRIARIGPVLDAATRSATVEVEIPNTQLRLKAEMFARVTLDLQSTRESVLIPRESLVYRGSQPGVYLARSGNSRPAFQAVETGQTLGEQVEVLSNLDPGTSIVTTGASMLREGDQIRVAGSKGGRGKRGGGQAASADASPQAPVQEADPAQRGSKGSGKGRGKRGGSTPPESGQ